MLGATEVVLEGFFDDEDVAPGGCEVRVFGGVGVGGEFDDEGFVLGVVSAGGDLGVVGVD